MPIILMDNFHFWRAKNDNFGPFTILAHLDHLSPLWMGTFSKMMDNFKIVAKALCVWFVWQKRNMISENLKKKIHMMLLFKTNEVKNLAFSIFQSRS